MIRDTFIQLLRVAAGCCAPEDFRGPDDPEDWMRIFELSKRQAVLGVMYAAIMSLPEDRRPPARVKVRFALAAEKIQAMNARANSAAKSLCAQLGEAGLRCCLLKGQGLALNYPDPSLRQSGDLDIWVGGGWRHTLETLRTRWKTGQVFYHHVDLDAFGGKPAVEIHFTPSWMNNPFLNRKLQRYFEAQAPSQLGRQPQGVDFPVPDVEFNLIFNIMHIYRHLLFEGVGLRQIMDYYFLLMRSDAAQRTRTKRLVGEFRVERFTAALMYVLKEIFLLDGTFCITPPDEKYGRQLLGAIYKGGNFGKYDSANEGLRKAALHKRFIRRMKRLSSFAVAYPSEVLWAPYFKTWQHLWRLTISPPSSDCSESPDKTA